MTRRVYTGRINVQPFGKIVNQRRDETHVIKVRRHARVPHTAIVPDAVDAVGINDDKMTGILEKAAKEVIGAENVTPATALMAGDDLAYFLKKVPGSYFWLGITPATGVIAPAHTAKFDIDEAALPIGVAIMHAAVHNALKEIR